MQIETICHIACADWLREYKNKTKKIFYFHPANGGKRNLREAALFKRMGVRAGVMDFWIFSACSILIVELKVQDKTLSPNQVECRDELEFLGYQVYTISTNDPKEAVRQLSALVLEHV